MDSIHMRKNPAQSTFNTLVKANAEVTIKAQKDILDRITNEYVLQTDRKILFDCLKLITDNDAMILPSTFCLMLSTTNLLWNALAGLIPSKNITNIQAVKSIWHSPEKQDRAIRQKIGSALIYFCPFDGKYSLRTADTLMRKIRSFIRKSQLKQVSESELDGFVRLYNKRMGNKDCFIVNYDFKVCEDGKIRPLVSTPQEVAARNHELIAQVENRLNNFKTPEQCFELNEWLDTRAIEDCDYPGMKSTITKLRTRVLEKGIYLHKQEKAGK